MPLLHRLQEDGVIIRLVHREEGRPLFQRIEVADFCEVRVDRKLELLRRLCEARGISLLRRHHFASDQLGATEPSGAMGTGYLSLMGPQLNGSDISSITRSYAS